MFLQIKKYRKKLLSQNKTLKTITNCFLHSHLQIYTQEQNKSNKIYGEKIKNFKIIRCNLDTHILITRKNSKLNSFCRMLKSCHLFCKYTIHLNLLFRSIIEKCDFRLLFHRHFL